MDPHRVGLLKGKTFTNQTGTLVNPQHIADVSNNSQITILKKDHKENIYDFDIPLFCDSDRKQINTKSILTTYYDHAWYSFARAEDSSWLQLIAVLPHIHNYDLESDSDSMASSSTTSINKTIQNSPAVLSTTNSPLLRYATMAMAMGVVMHLVTYHKHHIFFTSSISCKGSATWGSVPRGAHKWI